MEPRWLVALLFLCSALLNAATPGATVRTKLDVPQSLRRGEFTQDQFLNIPPGFRISLFALVGGARFLAVAPNGDVLVSQPGAGAVTLLRPDPSGVPKSFTYVNGLRNPHDIVFHTMGDTTWVYISESNQINRFVYNSGDTRAHDREIVIRNLPDASTPELKGSYGHQLKNIALSEDHKL